MNTKRIFGALWRDPVLSRVSDDAKFMFIYLHSCSHSNMLGIYLLPYDYVHADTGWGHDRIRRAYSELERVGEFYYHDEFKYAVIKKYLLRCQPRTRAEVQRCAQEVDELPPGMQALAEVADIIYREYTAPIADRLRARAAMPVATEMLQSSNCVATEMLQSSNCVATEMLQSSNCVATEMLQSSNCVATPPELDENRESSGTCAQSAQPAGGEKPRLSEATAGLQGEYPLSLSPHTPLSLSTLSITSNNKYNNKSNKKLELVRELEGGCGGEGDSEACAARAPKKPKTVKRRTVIPENFSLTAAMRSYAYQRGLSAAETEEEFEHFRNYHTSKGSLMSDWGAAWRTWAQRTRVFGRVGRAEKNKPTETQKVWKDIKL